VEVEVDLAESEEASVFKIKGFLPAYNVSRNIFPRGIGFARVQP
jgi:hypothetical protein